MFAGLFLLAQLQALPPQLVALDSDEGRRLLVEARASRDFYALAGTFEQQHEQSFCGIASSVAVLNALPIEAPLAMGSFRAFTQDNAFDAAARAGARRGGLTLDQLAGLLASAGTEARAVHPATLEAFRTDVAQKLATGGDYVIANFLRSAMHQDFGAHFSPVAAYNEQADRFLVLDVNRQRYPPYWVTAQDLFAAMHTFDPDAGAQRGYVVVRKASSARPRIPVPPVAHRLFAFALAALGLVFTLGAAAGALFWRWRVRRDSAMRAASQDRVSTP